MRMLSKKPNHTEEECWCNPKAAGYKGDEYAAKVLKKLRWRYPIKTRANLEEARACFTYVAIICNVLRI